MRWLNKFLFSAMIVTAMPAFLGGCGQSALVSVPSVLDKPIAITGESLNTLGQMFVATGKAMNAALDAKQVTASQYNSWRTFALRFKADYPVAVKAWKEAVRVNDSVKANDVAQTLALLTRDLMAFTTVTMPH